VLKLAAAFVQVRATALLRGKEAIQSATAPDAAGHLLSNLSVQLELAAPHKQPTISKSASSPSLAKSAAGGAARTTIDPTPEALARHPPRIAWLVLRRGLPCAPPPGRFRGWVTLPRRLRRRVAGFHPRRRCAHDLGAGADAARRRREGVRLGHE